MWVVMMVAMMLPSLVPMLAHYRRALGEQGQTNAGTLSAVVGAGYFLGCCRCVPADGWPRSPEFRSAWRHGLRLGFHCVRCCSGLMLILLVIGVMDLVPMAIVAAAITIERVAPWPRWVARATGLTILASGLLAIARRLAGT